MPQQVAYRDALVADVWGPLSSGSAATGTPLSPLVDVDVFVAGVGAVAARTGAVPWSRVVRLLKAHRGVSVRISADADDSAAVRRVADSLATLLLSCDALEVARPDLALPGLKLTGIGIGDILLVDAGRLEATDSWGSLARLGRRGAERTDEAAEAYGEPPAGAEPARIAAHALLARDLRELTGLPAATLGASLGVTREQYQRWLRGSPISTIRHGQLGYLHTIAADAVRRLGLEEAHIWWRTPFSVGTTPEQLLTARLIDRLHRIVSELPDPAPVVGDVLVALPAQQPIEFDPDEELVQDGDDSWAPYGEAGPPHA
jgi:hypothetical protein